MATADLILRAMADKRIVLIDVGARGGLAPQWKPLESGMTVIAFEPDPIEAHHLRDKAKDVEFQLVIHETAVWDRKGDFPFFVTIAPNCSSLLPPDHNSMVQFPIGNCLVVDRTLAVSCLPLDDILSKSDKEQSDFLKVDVQGGALEVLRGSEKSLENLCGLEVEVEFIPLYRNQALFGDIDSFLRAKGFELIDLGPTYYRRTACATVAGCKGQIVYADALYMATPDHFTQNLQSLAKTDQKRKYLAMLACCEAYGLLDRMVLYYEALQASPPLLALRMDTAIRDITARVRKGTWLSRFPWPAREGLSNILRDLADAVLSSPQRWAIRDNGLANRLRSRKLQILR